ncbi:hypothetical protein [Luteimonas terrae]|uniref:Large polyvalent protein associated domain-containing protein n=1 Tax=Luteimonas terrae TaxID=1530191 RepID=A0ABU1XVC3_9GAMM|nr:hypothetical protein [Luteimonas terrae]MDR7192706.1 hypothetical protein [Luteimonas terrae]
MAGPWERYQQTGIDRSRPIIENGDGSFSTERTITASFDEGGREVFYNIPTIVNGRDVGEDEAIRLYRAGQNSPVGQFGSLGEAESAAVRRSNEIGNLRGGDREGPWSKYQAASSAPALEIDITGGTPVPAAEFDQSTPASGELRGLGLSARSTVQGVGSLLGALGGDALNAYVVNPIQSAVTGQDVPFQSFRDIAGGWADRAGLPAPENSRERVLGDVGEALTGTGLTMGIGGGLNALAGIGRSAAGPVGVNHLARLAQAPAAPPSRLGQLLTAQPVLQATSAGAGSAASSVVRESGGGTAAQISAGLLGGLAPGAMSIPASAIPGFRQAGTVPYAAGQGARSLLRGTNADGSQRSAADVATTVNHFAAAGTTPSVGQAGGSRVGAALETYLGNVPGGAGRMARFGEQQSREVSERIDQLAGNLSGRGAQDRTAVGRSVIEGVAGDSPTSFIPRTRVVADRLYQRVEQAIPQGTRVDVGATRKELADLNASIEGAPNVSRFFQNARIQGIEGALLEDTGGVSGVLSRPQMREQADSMRTQLRTEAATQRQALNEYEQQVRGQLEAQAQSVAAESRRMASLGFGGNLRQPMSQAQIDDAVRAEMSRFPKPITSADIDLQVNDWLVGQADNRLPYEALSKLRTLVGNEIDNYSLVDNVPRSKWKSLYGALSKDMEVAASTPDAKQAWQRANSYYNARIKRLEDIDAVVSRAGGPERVYAAAFGDVKHGGTTIRQVMQSLPKGSQRELTAAFVRRMGQAINSQQDADGAVFSMSTFLTRWNEISPEAKRAIFDRHGLGFSHNMDKIARMASSSRQASQVFHNTSGTSRLSALIAQLSGTAATAGTALATGNIGVAALALAGSSGSAVGANWGARMMTNPRAVAWLASNGEKPVGELLGQIQVLRQAAERSGDDELLEIAEGLEAASSEAGAPAGRRSSPR